MRINLSLTDQLIDKPHRIIAIKIFKFIKFHNFQLWKLSIESYLKISKLGKFENSFWNSVWTSSEWLLYIDWWTCWIKLPTKNNVSFPNPMVAVTCHWTKMIKGNSDQYNQKVLFTRACLIFSYSVAIGKFLCQSANFIHLPWNLGRIPWMKKF